MPQSSQSLISYAAFMTGAFSGFLERTYKLFRSRLISAAQSLPCVHFFEHKRRIAKRLRTAAAFVPQTARSLCKNRQPPHIGREKRKHAVAFAAFAYAHHYCFCFDCLFGHCVSPLFCFVRQCSLYLRYISIFPVSVNISHIMLFVRMNIPPDIVCAEALPKCHVN